MNNPPIRNAFVLGAGLGTRLLSLTARRPKPLIPICQKPLITFAFDHLLRSGVEKIVVNTHHRHEAYAQTFPDRRYRNVALHFEHEPMLLETGGGIKNVEQFLRGSAFIVYNGDILTDLPLERAIQFHFEQKNEVTLILRTRGGAPLHIALDEKNGRVVDIANRLGSGIAAKYMFTGIYIVNPTFLFRIPSRTKISVIPIFMRMIQSGNALGGIAIDEGEWWDLGTRESYLEAHRYFAQPDFAFVAERGGSNGKESAIWPQWIHPSARVSPGVKIEGATVIGAGAVIGAHAQLSDCVLWENAVVAPGSVLKNCIVTTGQTASGASTNQDF